MSGLIAHALMRYRPAIGGVEHYVEKLSGGIARAGYTVHIHTTRSLTWGAGMAPAELPASVAHYEPGPPEVFRHAARPLMGSRYALCDGMLRGLLREDADIFHAHYYGHCAADAAALAARLKRRPLVVNPYAAFEGEHSLLARLYAAGPGRLLRGADRIITISAFEERALAGLGFDRAKFVRIPPGIDAREFAQVMPRPAFFPPEGPVLIFVGRLAAAKGVMTILDAAPEIRARIPEARIVMIGPEFGEGERITEQLQRRGLAQMVSLAGSVPREDLVAAYLHADLFLFPSVAEAFGIVLAEAMAAGLVPIASNTMSIPEVVGAAGVLVPPGDARALARETIGLLSDPMRRRELSDAARERARTTFDWERSVAMLASVYGDLTAGRRAPRTILALGFSNTVRTGGERLYRELLDGAVERGLAIREVSQQSIPAWAQRRGLTALWAATRMAKHRGSLLFLDLSWCPRLLLVLPFARWLMRQRIAIGVCHRPSSGDWTGLAARMQRILETAFLRHADHVLAISRSTAREVEAAGVATNRILVIYPAIPALDPPAHTTALSAASPGRMSQRGPLRLATVGTVTDRKGYEDIIDALARLGPGWHLDVAGSVDANPRCVARLRRRIASCGLDDRVRLLGHLGQEQRRALLEAADIYVHPSHWEGFGYAVAEAMQIGLPVVAARAGAVPELIDHGVTGILVEPGSPEALARALADLAADPQRMARLGRAGAASIARFSNPGAQCDAFAAALAHWAECAGREEAVA